MPLPVYRGNIGVRVIIIIIIIKSYFGLIN